MTSWKRIPPETRYVDLWKLLWTTLGITFRSLHKKFFISLLDPELALRIILLSLHISNIRIEGHLSGLGFLLLAPL